MSSRTHLVLCVFLILFVSVFGDFYGKTTGVINADISNFDKLVAVNEDEVVMIEFYAPWCGHCKQLVPEYVKLAKSLKNVVKIVAMDASDDKNRGIASKYGVQGFPTLKVHVGTGPAQDYQGQRDSASMKRHLLGLLPNYATRVTTKKLDKFLEKNNDKPRALIFGKKDDASPTVKRFSALMRDHMIFGTVSKKYQKDIAKKFDISTKGSSILLVFEPGSNKEPKMFSGNTKSFKEVQGWLYSFAPGLEMEDSEALPKLLDHSCYVQKCEKKGLCVILIRGEDDADYTKTHTILKEIEDTSDDASLFAFSQITASEGTNYEWLTKLFGNMDTYYSNIIVLAPIKKRYSHYVGSVTSSAIKGFISGVLTGKTRTSEITAYKKEELPTLSKDTELCKPVKPKPKPKPKPQQQQQQSGQQQYPGTPKSGPGGGSQFIVTINGDNYQQIMYGNNQPLIVEFYAPWCGHCKSLAPEFAKAATNMKGMVLFGAVNCDEDSNKPLCGEFQVKGFPTLKVFGAGSERKQKNGAKDFQGPRTAVGLERAATDTLLSIKIPSLTSKEDYNEFISMDEAMAKILLFSSKTKAPTLLRALAAAFDTVSFAMVNEKQTELVELLNIDKFPNIVGFTKGEQTENGQIYQGSKTFIELTKWVVSLMQKSGEEGGGTNHEEL